MRKLLSILLVAVFCLPMAMLPSELSASQTSQLPACCRQGGKHHCAMHTAESGTLAAGERHFSAPAEKCPYCPSALIATHAGLVALPTANAVFASLVSHPSGVAQTESMRRIARDRSRQKRGPPARLG